MNCPQVQDLKNAYLDRELDLVTSRDIDGHLTSCSACSQSYGNLRALNVAVQSADLYFDAPSGLDQSIRAALGLESRANTRARLSREWSRWRGWFVWPIPIAATATATFLFAAAIFKPGVEDLLTQEITASHVRSLMADHLTDVASSDQHTVKPWFDGKVDFAPSVTDLASEGYPLQGGRLDYLEHRPVAALVYHRNKHVINLFIWPDDAASQTTKRTMVRQGYNLIHWESAGTHHWAISDLNQVELRQFADLIR